ncbi:ABC transporter permease [Lewinella sp. IMCC34183]|uniref:ABC transporter permease n=1 Tax=Lewinella sp. IMCC34183 TaxID=2248762 RepID=UPI000E25C1B9|nr:ABC transporter permease [Lewinella sp. IMCC34183]
MLTAIRQAFQETLSNLRSNFFHSILSVLGMIVGVAALVAMLSLIDGLELLARKQISANTTVETVVVRQRTTQRLDGLEVPLDTVAEISRPTMDSMLAALPFPATGQLYATDDITVPHPRTGEQLALRYAAVSLPIIEDIPAVSHGRDLRAEDEDGSRPVAIVNTLLASRLVGEVGLLPAALGQRLLIAGQEVEVVGILPAEGQEFYMEATLPLTVLQQADPAPSYSTQAIVHFTRVEDVRPGADFIAQWFGERYPDIERPVSTQAQLSQVEDLEEGFLLFRVVMGLLIGIAVVVGGLGVMNVMLMSINERTPEIGIRKAVGASRQRIIAQFLSESVAISTVGCLLGLLLGVLLSVPTARIIAFYMDQEFTAVFSLNTLAVVLIVALLTGIVFGTYPARRAAGLDPVAAIQRV